MKQLIKKVLKRGLHPIIVRLGYRENSSELSLLQNFFSILKEIDFIPKHIVDVGANHGGWTRTALTYFPDAYYSMLEPQNWLKDHVIDLLESNPKIKFYAVGAGSQSQRLKFTIAGRDDSSSFIYYTEEQAKNAGYKQIDVDVITLNEFIPQNNLIQPDIIKIDAEGFDLEVLKGASNFLGKTEIFMVEAGVVAKYIENSFSKVVEFMDLNGYKLFDITDLNRPFKPSVLWLTELVFVKKNGLIDGRKIVHQV